MKVLLRNRELWQKFKEHQTEMNVTKEGRRMCPVISLTFEDLNPTKMYAVMVDFVFADEFRYCFDATANRWVPWGLIKEANCSRMYLHPETPTTGAILMKSVLTFKKLKLSNSLQTAWSCKEVMLMNTMRRYFPRIHILESPDGASFDHRLRSEFCFAETDFIAVSAYKNKQITQLKIEANPFASAYRSHGLHGQAKRRRMESNNALKKWKATLEDDSPSNSSSLEDSSNNDDETDFENDKSSANEPVHAPAPVQNYDEQELNGIRAALPFLKERLRRDVSYYICNPIHNEALSQERAAHSPQATEDHPTMHTSNLSVSTSQLTCEESSEWMWGFDEQMSMRYSPDRPELEAFLPKMADNPGIATKSRDEASNEQERVDYRGDGIRDATKGTVNRRKKYLPRKLQRTGDIILADSGSIANEVRIQIQADEPTTNEANLSASSQSQVTECKGDNKEERLSSEVTKPLDSSLVISPCDEADKSSSLQEMVTFQDQDSPISSLRTTPGLSVTCQDGSSLSLKDSDETTQARKALMTISSIPENKTDSSLTALIHMCSEGGGSLSDKSYLPQSKQDQSGLTTGVSSVCQVPFSEESTTASSSSSCDSVPSDVQSIKPSTTSDDQEIATLGSKDEERTSSPCTSTCSSSSEHVTSSAMLSTSLSMTTVTSAVVSNSCEISLRTAETFDKVSTTTAQFQAAVAVEKSCPGQPSHMNSIPGHVFVSEFSRGQLSGEKHPGYRPIAPNPNQSVEVNTVESTVDVFQDNGYYHDNALYPIIVDSFSLTKNVPYSIAHPPQVNQSYYATPNSYHTGLTGHTGFVAFNNTVAKQAPYLEKFYSFSVPNKQEHQVSRSRLRGSRHYRTTRTNFSRLSLEPLCSVIYPLTSGTPQLSSQGNPSKESVNDVATFSQGTWYWWVG